MNTYKITTLQNQLEKLRNLQEKREQTFNDRSDKWQESDKGESFEFRTQELEGIIDDLENAIDALNDWNEKE